MNRRDTRHFLIVGTLLALLVFVGFARTYYLKPLFGTHSLSVLTHLHGFAMSAWYGLYVLQVYLVGARRLSWHRTLGWVGAGLALLVSVLNAAVSVHKVRSDLQHDPSDVGAMVLFSLQMLAITLPFLATIGLAVWYRRRPDWHKRFMTLAMLMTIGPAIARLPLGAWYEHNVPIATLVAIGVLIITIGADWIRTKRLHPVYGGGFVVIIGLLFGVSGAAQTASWQRGVRALLGIVPPSAQRTTPNRVQLADGSPRKGSRIVRPIRELTAMTAAGSLHS